MDTAFFRATHKDEPDFVTDEVVTRQEAEALLELGELFGLAVAEDGDEAFWGDEKIFPREG